MFLGGRGQDRCRDHCYTAVGKVTGHTQPEVLLVIFEGHVEEREVKMIL